MTLGDALKQRRSYRDMTEQEVDLQTVSTILWAACGISDPATGKITAPSAVNMQDIKVFVCSQYGVCRYMPKENTLEPVTMTDIRPSLAAGQDFAKTAPVSLILVSTKDNERMDNNRYGGVDAGYVSQNIYLACTALGLHTVARAMMACSSSLSGWKSSIYPKLSSICSMLLMPLSTIITLGNEAQ